MEEGHGDAICLARQLFADPDWALKAQEDRADDIRRCVAANHCWKAVSRGGRVQCIYNPTMAREGIWGKKSMIRVDQPRKVLVIGGGPSGLEFSRIAAARGHQVVILEREAEPGGHSRLQGLLPSRAEFATIGRWLAQQARKNGADLRTDCEVTPDNLDEILAAEKPDHVVVATGARVCKDGFQGWTAAPLPGYETGRCVGWDDVVTGKVQPRGNVVVFDDQCDVVGPLTAVAMAENGADSVKIVTRWPMIGMDTILDAYLEWILPRLYQSGVEIICDRFVRAIEGDRMTIFNLYNPRDERVLAADWVIMATARQSNNALYSLIKERGLSVETIGDAVAPRGTYEAVFEGHRQGRKV